MTPTIWVFCFATAVCLGPNPTYPGHPTEAACIAHEIAAWRRRHLPNPFTHHHSLCLPADASGRLLQ